MGKEIASNLLTTHHSRAGRTFFGLKNEKRITDMAIWTKLMLINRRRIVFDRSERWREGVLKDFGVVTVDKNRRKAKDANQLRQLPRRFTSGDIWRRNFVTIEMQKRQNSTIWTLARLRLAKELD